MSESTGTDPEPTRFDLVVIGSGSGNSLVTPDFEAPAELFGAAPHHCLDRGRVAHVGAIVKRAEFHLEALDRIFVA